MSSNIYEKPNELMNARYSKGARGDRGERMERLVDIYESFDPLTDHRVDFSTQDGGANTRHPPAVLRDPFTIAAVILGLLCLVLLIGITVLFNLYNSVSLQRDQLTEANKLRTNISESLCPEGWKRSRCSCYYKSTEMKSWDDSRADCKNRTADLVVVNNKEEQEFLSELNEGGTSWIGLQYVKTSEWSEKWEWKWVDGSTPSYMAIAKDQPVPSVKRSTVSINQQGTWIISNEPKQWICEREVS
ncbi:killer cell lectin-like receptor subfamily B member 1B allele C isoform X1 [Thunnus albacares]|uniref:killer cell lectin-like receptor subfamily B member 1B allele C isoform X1 n=1 Tax=Thunnus albacares TaxID=8236 RepID=UPI001CF63EE1|nr:killer cell lectin-like receptor subfamily B member 1B allele C isoform X1 [Thunnus albacares]